MYLRRDREGVSEAMDHTPHARDNGVSHASIPSTGVLADVVPGYEGKLLGISDGDLLFTTTAEARATRHPLAVLTSYAMFLLRLHSAR